MRRCHAQSELSRLNLINFPPCLHVHYFRVYYESDTRQLLFVNASSFDGKSEHFLWQSGDFVFALRAFAAQLNKLLIT